MINLINLRFEIVWINLCNFNMNEFVTFDAKSSKRIDRNK